MKYSFPFKFPKLKFPSIDFSNLKSKKTRPMLLGLILCFLLIIGLVCCSGSDTPDEEILMCTVSSDSLNVHKKSSADSRVLGQLPSGFEIEILEQTTSGETNWGYIEMTELSDGTKIKAGWIDLQYVRFAGEPEPTDPPVEPTTDTQPEPPVVNVNMGTVTASKLHIRKGPGSKYETDGAYFKGDRIEIVATETVDGTIWGQTNLGWVGMGYVRMDGIAVSTEENPAAARILSNGNTAVLGYGVVDLGKLNVRLGPGTEYEKIGTVKLGTRYAYYQISANSDNWVRIEDGWVSTDHFYLEGTTADNAITGTVTTDDLNVRTGPGTNFKSIMTLQAGETVEVLAQVDRWGYTEQGWVFMSYVEPLAPTYSTGTCTVTRGLNIRQEPSADSEKVGELVEGNVVTILEVQGGWGRVVQGWINLNYVEYETIE